MAIIYENILNRMEVKGFNQKTQAEKQRYVTAIDYLAEELSDPLNVTQNVTRFQLYRRSQDLYNRRRLEMEDTIDRKRKELPAIEYERWFQRNYPSLNSGVEGAYTEWLIFGQKEIVELYKSYLDVESPGIDLEESRMALRASGVSALDRTRTIYPVSFVPSNWYRYLTNVTTVDIARQDDSEQSVDQLSRDQLQYKIGELEAKKRVLQVLKEVEPLPELRQNLTQLQRNLNTSNEALSGAVQESERKRQLCLASRIRAKADNSTDLTPECKEYETSTSTASDSILTNSELYQCVGDLDFQINSLDDAREAFDNAITAIERELADLRRRLLVAGIKYPHLAQHAADTQDQLDSKWLQFRFNSSKEIRKADSSFKSYSVAVSIKASGWFWSARGSFSYSKSESSFRREMNNADVNINGELLRVGIYRPWFRPSLFKSTQFQLKLDEESKVSPGPKPGEEQFIKETAEKRYLLPEYVTGLLLSRNVEIEFKGVSALTTSHAIRVSSSSRLSGGFGPWKASISRNYNRGSNSFKAESIANGLRITIPGAQVIGYYTRVTPKFP